MPAVVVLTWPAGFSYSQNGSGCEPPRSPKVRSQLRPLIWFGSWAETATIVQRDALIDAQLTHRSSNLAAATGSAGRRPRAASFAVRAFTQLLPLQQPSLQVVGLHGVTIPPSPASAFPSGPPSTSPLLGRRCPPRPCRLPPPRPAVPTAARDAGEAGPPDTRHAAAHASHVAAHAGDAGTRRSRDARGRRFRPRPRWCPRFPVAPSYPPLRKHHRLPRGFPRCRSSRPPFPATPVAVLPAAPS